jgi:signal transduction histidine kinase
MKHRYKGSGSPTALIFIILFLLMLIVMNGQLLRGTYRLDDFIDEVDSLSGNWSQLQLDLLTRGLPASIVSNRILLLQDYTQAWLLASELNFLDGMFGLDVPFEKLNSDLSALTNPTDESFAAQSQIERIEIALNELKSSMTDFRRQLSDGYSFLVQAQVILIILMAALIYIAMENGSRQRQEIAGSRRIQEEIVQAQEEERNRIALDLHDDVAQELSWLRLDVSNTESWSERIRVLDSLLNKIRELSSALRTPDFTLEFFDDAVHDMIDRIESRTPIRVIYLPGTRNPDQYPDLYGHLYRIMQECLNNAVRHAGAGRVFIEIQEERGLVFFEYRDDGRGFDVEKAMGEGRLGLRGIRNRVSLCGGSSEIESISGKGTVLRCRLPLNTGMAEKTSND